MKNKKIIIAGGSGFIGHGIAHYFGKENEIVILGRNIKNHENNLYAAKSSDVLKRQSRQVIWDANTMRNWTKELESADIVINLVGKSVNCRYHENQRREIINSRVNATNIIGEAIRNCVHPPKLWINAASATIYQHSLHHAQDEFNGQISDRKVDNMPWSFLDQVRLRKNRVLVSLLHGKKSQQYKNLDRDFSVQVCKLWESAFFDQRTPFTRKIAMRMAITLGKGGVLTPYLNLCKLGLGGKHGTGEQMFSWVHIEDVCRFIEWVDQHKESEGIYNCVAPNAVSNTFLMHSLRKAIGKRVGLPAPAWLLELGARLIGSETELMLKSRWVYPKRSMNEGFIYKYQHIEHAIDDILRA